LDFENLLNLKAFEAVTMNGTGRSVKPVSVTTADGDPDKEPRHLKVINLASPVQIVHKGNYTNKHNAHTLLVANVGTER
jgi:hypothetical protein